MNKLQKRVFLLLIGIFLSIQVTFAANNFILNSLSNILGENGLFGLLSNKFVAVSAIYIAMLIGFLNLVKVVIRVLPIFKNSQKEANVVSFALAFMGVTGIFFMYKDSPENMIVQFGGSIGFFLMSIVFGSILMGLNRMLNNIGFKSFSSSGWWMWMGLAMFIVGSILMQLFVRVLALGGVISNFVTGFLENFVSIGFIAFLIGLIIYIGHKNRQKKHIQKEFETQHPEIVEARNVSNRLISHVNRLEELARNLVK